MTTVDIPVRLAERSYQVSVGAGLLDHLGSRLRELAPGGKVLLVTSATVRRLYGRQVEKNLEDSGFDVVPAEVPDGEEAKTLAMAGVLYDRAYAAGLDRQSPVVALGGGTVGDLAGFVAATYMRGVPFIQVPTTLLAQVDSSVGGKVAVNHPRGKNIIGAFYQPKMVLADTSVLATLDRRELRSGLAEVIKYGVIADADFFSWLESNLERVLTLESSALLHAVAVSCRIKARIVEEDETEQGRRAILNFGHTVGHAVEVLTDYGVRHGEAVAAGMVQEAKLAAMLGVFPEEEAARLELLVKRAGLPVKKAPLVKEPPAKESSFAKEVLDLLRRDKKSTGGRYVFALPVKIGKVEIFFDVPEEKIRRLVADF
jgi:3-dehydroquinate synthase